MGCWNATCNVTNLPIYVGEKVVLIPLAKVKDDCDFNACYPTDVFVPFALPLIGEYDDYGAIENVQTTDENKKHLLNDFNYFYGRNDGCNTEYEVAEKYEDFERFVSQVLCCHGGCYIKTNSSLHKNGMVEINYMMIHYDAYMLMVDEIANRKPYGSSANMRETLTNKILEKIAKAREDIARVDVIKKDLECAEDKSKSIALTNALSFSTYLDFTREIFAIGMLNPCAVSWFSMAKKLIHEDDTDDLIAQFVDVQLFTKALSCLRKGYLCDSGAGSQSEETRIHYLIAQYVIKHIADIAEAHKEYDEDDTTSPYGVEETFFV